MKFNYRYIWLLFAFSTLVTCCHSQTNSIDKKKCLDYYEQAKSKLNEYYTINNDSSLHLSLSNTEKALRVCPNYKVRLVDLKVTLLMLMKEYKRGYEFIDSLDVKDFITSYKRSLYLNTFKALYFDKQGVHRRDSCFNELVTEIELYISKNPSDKSAIADLFFTKIKFHSKETVIKEIELFQAKNQDENDFFESLKETIKSTPVDK